MALSEGKTQTSKAHILEAHQVVYSWNKLSQSELQLWVVSLQKILEETKVRRKQRTLDEMVKRK